MEAFIILKSQNSVMLNEQQTEIIHKEATEYANEIVEMIPQLLEDTSHAFIVHEFEGNDDDEIEKLKEVYKEKFWDELYKIL